MIRLTAARRERIIRVGSWLILVLALMPAITYMGHWPIAGLHVHAEESADPAAALAEHADHCHVGVSHCAGGEAMVGSSWVGDEPDLLSLGAPNVKIEGEMRIAPREGASVRILQPPQAA